MRVDKDTSKERKNIEKQKLDFSFAEIVLSHPLAILVCDRYENGEHRWHAFAPIGGRLLLVVHTYPDPDDEERARVIGLREATRQERRRYEEGKFD